MLVCLMRVKNAERKIARTLDAMPFVDRFIVVDNGCTDGTLDIVRQYPSTILHTKGLHADRDIQLAYEEALGMGADWVLQMDADEEWEKRAATELPKLLEDDFAVGWRFRKMCFVIYKDFYRTDRGWAPFCEPEWELAWPILLFRCQPTCYFEDPRQCSQGVVKGLRGPIRSSDLRVKHWGWDSEEDIERKLAFYKKYHPDRDLSHLRNDELAVFKRWIE